MSDQLERQPLLDAADDQVVDEQVYDQEEVQEVKRVNKCFKYTAAVTGIAIVLVACFTLLAYFIVIPKVIQQKMLEAAQPSIQNVTITNISANSVSMTSSLLVPLNERHAPVVNVGVGEALWSMKLGGSQLMDIEVGVLDFMTTDPIPLTVSSQSVNFNQSLLTELLSGQNQSQLVSLQGSPSVSLFKRLSWSSIQLKTEFAMGEPEEMNVSAFNIRIEGMERMFQLDYGWPTFKPTSSATVVFDMPLHVYMNNLTQISLDVLYEDVKIANVQIHHVLIVQAYNNTVKLDVEVDLNTEAEKKLMLLASRYFKKEQVYVDICDVQLTNAQTLMPVTFLNEPLKNFRKTVAIPKKQ